MRILSPRSAWTRKASGRLPVVREFYGFVARIPPHPPHRSGALAQCAFCEWGRFFADRKRMRYSSVARASASLRVHAKKVHGEKFPCISTARKS